MTEHTSLLAINTVASPAKPQTTKMVTKAVFLCLAVLAMVLMSEAAPRGRGRKERQMRREERWKKKMELLKQNTDDVGGEFNGTLANIDSHPDNDFGLVNDSTVVDKIARRKAKWIKKFHHRMEKKGQLINDSIDDEEIERRWAKLIAKKQSRKEKRKERNNAVSDEDKIARRQVKRIAKKERRMKKRQQMNGTSNDEDRVARRQKNRIARKQQRKNKRKQKLVKKGCFCLSPEKLNILQELIINEDREGEFPDLLPQEIQDPIEETVDDNDEIDEGSFEEDFDDDDEIDDTYDDEEDEDNVNSNNDDRNNAFDSSVVLQ